MRNVFFKAEAASLKFNFEAGLTLLESLTKLLLESGSNAPAELVFTLSQQGFMALFQATDLQLFHLNEPLFHLVFEIGFNLAESLLQGLIVIEFQSFLLNRKPAFVFLVQLSFNRDLHLGLSLFQSLVLFDTVLFVHGLNLSLKSEVQFVANPSLFSSKCIPFHGFQFGLHGRPKFVFEGVQRQLVLGCEVLGDVGLHGVDTFGDGLLAKSTLSPQVGAQSLLLPEPGSCAHRLVQRGGIC